MDRFLLAENPVNPGAIYIVHTVAPRCLIRILQPDEEWPQVEGIKFTHRNSDGMDEDYGLTLADSYDPVPDRVQLFNRAWRWWVAYLKWEDKNIDNEEL